MQAQRKRQQKAEKQGDKTKKKRQEKQTKEKPRLNEGVGAGGGQMVVGHFPIPDSPVTVGLNAQIVDASNQVEPAALSPVGSPAVADNPVLLACLHSVPDNFNFMIQRLGTSVIFENARGVVEQRRGHGNGARNGTTGEELDKHVGFSANLSVFRDVNNWRILDSLTSTIRAAVTASVFRGALLVLGQIVGAGHVIDSVFIHPAVSGGRIATITTLGVVGGHAINQDLNRRLNVWEGTLALKLDAVSKSTQRTMSPARAAVLRNVLVEISGGVVNTADVARIILSGDILDRDVSLRQRRHNVGLGVASAHSRRLEVVVKLF
eukprot:m.8810 g.8810  ORF g.8810 m.8810 type:complete len:321 (-) comp7068_c0_seq1:950-1912(-)